MLARERTWHGDAEIRARLMRIWQVMQDCVRRGFEAQGLLPGVLGVRRRAPKLHRMLMSADPAGPMIALDWVNVFALAVNEENAAGGQVVTAPTNGAAGIVPAVLHYYRRFEPGADDEGVVRFLLTRRGDRHALQTERVDFRAPKWAARARSASPARWPPPDWSRR